MTKPALKTQVHDFWDEASCGEVYAQGDDEKAQLNEHARMRYALEPYIWDFAKFSEGAGKDVLEIGVGMGADHAQWAQANPKSLTGVDLTLRAVEHTRKRLKLLGFTPNVRVADAEKLPFQEESFDLVYSWGVIHHSPDTAAAVREIYRVLRPNGTCRVMIYHTFSLTGFMLWIKYALLKLKPWTSLKKIYATYLESPGTKAYSVGEAKKMFQDAGFRDVSVRIQLGHGDLLQGEVGQRHKGTMLTLAKALWPRFLIKTCFPFLGLYLLIEARK